MPLIVLAIVVSTAAGHGPSFASASPVERGTRILAGVAYLVGSRVLHLPRSSVGSLIVCTLVVNTGYLAYAVVAALLGFDALAEAAAFDVLVGSPALLLGAFAAGAAFGDDAGEGVRERTRAFFIRNPILYAAIAALLVATCWRRRRSSMPPGSSSSRSSRSASSRSARRSPRTRSRGWCRGRFEPLGRWCGCSALTEAVREGGALGVRRSVVWPALGMLSRTFRHRAPNDCRPRAPCGSRTELAPRTVGSFAGFI